MTNEAGLHKPRKILLVEDDADHAALITRYLKGNAGDSTQIEHASSLGEGLARLACGEFDVILLDLGLPDGDPTTVLQRILEAGSHLPVIVLTALDDMDAAAQAVKQGAQDFLVKAKLDRDILHRSINYAIERKAAEEQLRRLNETLEQRVAERSATAEFRADQLRALASELILTEQRQRRRLATELHDYLAQLLVVCRMKLSVLQGMVHEPGSMAVIADAQEMVENSLRYTRTLVAELSPTVLYEAGLDTALQWLARQMEKHGLKVNFTQNGEVEDIPEDHAVLLFQSVRELLFNVIKHAGVSEASLTLDVFPGSELHISVSDSGQGCDLLAIRQSDEQAPKFGLFSIHERLGAIGGRFEMESVPGEGTCATLIIPIVASERGEPQPIAHPELEPRRAGQPLDSRSVIRVLLADDHALVRQGLSSLLADYGDVQVIGEAGNGEEAVEMARELQPDTVVMDINMPKVNGLEATRRIKTEMPDITVLALSVLDDKEMAAQMRRAGASAYLTKDGAADELYETIRRLHRIKRTTPSEAFANP